MEALEGEMRAPKEENTRLREALGALEPPKRRPWWRFWGYPHSAPPSLQETISPCPQQAHRSLVMGGQVEDKGPALQLHQAHPDEELSARALALQHRVAKSGLWKGFSGAPTAAFAAVGYLEDPAQGGSLSTELPPGSDGAIGFALRKLHWALQTDRLRESGSCRVRNSGSLEL